MRLVLAAISALFVVTMAQATAPICTGECMAHPGVVTFNDRFEVAKQYAQANTSNPPLAIGSSPVSTVTPVKVVKGGDIAEQLIEWLQVAFGGTIGAAALWVIMKGLQFLGIKITDAQKAQLQAIIVNGINDAAVKAEAAIKNDPRLDIDIKSQVIADAVTYTQDHGAQIIKALGIDPNSGEAVEAIKARIATAINDPMTPTPPAITPAVAGGHA